MTRQSFKGQNDNNDTRATRNTNTSHTIVHFSPFVYFILSRMVTTLLMRVTVSDTRRRFLRNVRSVRTSRSDVTTAS